jgi:Zn-dependent oligopeptidase
MLSLLAEESFNIYYLGVKRYYKLGSIIVGVFRVFFKLRGLAD